MAHSLSWIRIHQIKIKLRFFKSGEHIYEKGDVPYCGFRYLSSFNDPIDLATFKGLMPHDRHV